jgi:hypothetical protein
VISVSYDDTFGYQGRFTEFGFLIKKRLFKHKTYRIFNEQNVKPESGFENFFYKIDSLNMIEIASLDNEVMSTTHQPFSIFVIEIKIGEKYNQFRFRSENDDSADAENHNYNLIEKFIYDEFYYNFYIGGLTGTNNKYKSAG